MLKVLSLSLYSRVSLSLSSRGRHWIECVMNFRSLCFMWVCEAVNFWTVFDVGHNGSKIAEVMRQDCGGLCAMNK